MKENFKNIDFIRFVMALLIVMFHFRNIAPEFIKNFIPGIVHCNVCVDFFFIMSGFFLFYTINAKQSVLEFATKRFFRLAPLVWFFLGFYMVLSIIIKNIHFSLTDNILRIFLLHDIGFGPLTGGVGAHVHWFISALFWTTLGYFYLVKLIDKKYLNPIIWLIIIFSYGLYLNCHKFTTGGNIANIFHFANIGILRALGGIGTGYFIHNIYTKNFLKNCSKISKVIISGLEIYLIGFLSHYLIFSSKIPGKTPMVFFVTYSILFYLFLIKKGLVSSILNNNLLAKLGQYSYAIYVMHPIMPAIVKNVLKPEFIKTHSVSIFTIQVISALILGIITHYIFEKPINNVIKNKLFNRN